MTSNATTFLAVTAIALAASMTGLSASAQVYRIVGPDGKVTFSDKPPPVPSAAKVTSPGTGGPGGTAAGSLPFELRQVTAKYPVTLYTGDNCGPCAPAKAFLNSRGVPFTEKTVTSLEDIQALQRLSGSNTLPVVAIGSQQLKGFLDSEWSQYLDAADYPKTSLLPPSYRQAPPSPLVAVATAPATSNAPVVAAPAPPPVAAPAPAANNPAGIKF